VSEPRFWLLPVHGGSPIELTKPLTLVGRQEDCDLPLEHKTISKMHCILMKSDGAVLIRDLGSTNGCRINGQKTKAGALLPNDVLSIAVFDFRLCIGDHAPGASPPTDKTEMIDMSQLAALDGGTDPQAETARPVTERSAVDERRGGGYQVRE
jgi:predicted component of type VI protein secretion system